MKPFCFCLFFVCLVNNSSSQIIGSTQVGVRQLPRFGMNDPETLGFINSYPKLENSLKEDWFYWVNYSRRHPKQFWDSVVKSVLLIYPHLRSKNTNSLQRELYAASFLPFEKWNATLEICAQRQADALKSIKSLPNHNSPKGESFSERIKKLGIKGCAGENISFGAGNSVFGLVLLYIDEGVPDLGHRRTLLDPFFTEVGIGISTYPNGQQMVVQDFSCDQNH